MRRSTAQTGLTLPPRWRRRSWAGDQEWSVGYGTTYEVDGLKLVANWGGGSYTARAMARVGRLLLRKGDWDGQQLIPPEWIEKATAYAGTPLPNRSPENPSPAS